MTTKWLEKATKKDYRRPEFGVIHGNMAADGFRIHRDNSLPAANDFLTQKIAECGLIPTQPRNRATVSRVDLLTACKQAYAFRDEWDRKNHRYPAISFCMNGSLQYSAKTEVGSTSGEIIDGTKVTDKITEIKNGLKYHTHTMVYKHHNPDKVTSFAIPSNQLMDALEGMEGETIEIDCPNPRAPFYMTDGTREAVIMPVKLSL